MSNDNMAQMLKEDAEEWTQGLGQTVAGAWRQIALAKRLGVPQALGLSVEQWVNERIGGYVKMSVAERQEAVNNLTGDGYSLREIGEILGVSHETARGAVKKLTPKPPKPPRALLPSQTTDALLKLCYADPPYIDCAYRYRDHPDYAGEVDHAALIAKLEAEFDGWVLHANGTVRSTAVLMPLVEPTGAHMCIWAKSFAASKPDVSVLSAWEAVFIKPARKPVVSGRQTNRDYIVEPCTMRRNFIGAKPENVCHWVFELLGAWPDDELVDLFPGSGAVSEAWWSWQRKFALPLFAYKQSDSSALPKVSTPKASTGIDSSEKMSRADFLSLQKANPKLKIKADKAVCL